MSFTKSIDILYNKFFDKNNFKDINLPFIDGTKELKFLKITSPKYYKELKERDSKRNALYRNKHYKPNLMTKAKLINTRCRLAQNLITKCINGIKQCVGDK